MKTKMTEFKRAIYLAQKLITLQEKKDSSEIRDLNNSFLKLLDDKKMMAAKNEFSFEQRTQLTIIVIFRILLDLIVDNYQKEKAILIFRELRNAGISIEHEQRETN